MRIRELKYLLLSLVITGMLFWASPSQAAKDYVAEKFDVFLVVQPDGSLLVTETVVFRFEGGPFTFAFRDLSYNELDEIDRLQASMDGQVLPQGTQPGMVEIEAGRPLKVTWHFAPTSDSTHELTLVYRVQGAVRQLEEDVLIWRAIPEEHEYVIESSRITLEYPVENEPLSVEVSGAQAEGVHIDNRYEFLTTNLEEDQSVVVTARFPAGSLVDEPPLWQEQQAIQAELNANAFQVGLTAGILASIAAVIGLIYYARRIRRESSLAAIPQKLTSPPANIRPALAANLVGSSTTVLAAIFDLAARGILSVKEAEKSWYGSRNFVIHRNTPAIDQEDQLRPHELGLLEALFVSKKGPQDSIPIGDVPGRLGGKNPFQRGLDEEMVTNGWRDEERKRLSTRMVILSVLFLVAGIIVLILGFVVIAWSDQVVSVLNAGAIMVGVAAAMAIWGLVGLIVGGTTSTLTISGLEQAAAWRGFAEYLKDITRGREQAVRPDTFEIYLPYAAGFGLCSQWAKHFEKNDGMVVPAWFRTLEGGMGSDDFAIFVIMMTSMHSSASSTSAGAGAAGASGGGASGAG